MEGQPHQVLVDVGSGKRDLGSEATSMIKVIKKGIEKTRVYLRRVLLILSTTINSTFSWKIVLQRIPRLVLST